jgi:ABC-2 type transport system ATP-binding protein
MDIAIKTRNLDVVKAKKKLLSDVTLDLPSGKIIGLLGPSGAGKTTLVRSLIGRQKIAEGDITVAGFSSDSPELREIIGYMPQTPAIYYDLTVKQNLHYFASARGSSKKDAEKLIDDVDLRPQANQLVDTLSEGQKSRVSLAIALIDSPKILFLDEPTVGIDPVLRNQLWKKFKSLSEGGTTILVTSHVMEEAEHCDYLILIRLGKILFYGTPSELKSKTKSIDVESSFLKLVGTK